MYRGHGSDGDVKELDCSPGPESTTRDLWDHAERITLIEDHCFVKY